MLGLGYNIETGIAGRRRSWRACPTLSPLSAAGGTAQMCADWAFVSPVSPVSPNLELIKDYRLEEWRRHRRALVSATPPYDETGETGPTNTSIMVRQQGRDTGGTAETHIGALRPRVPRVSPTHRRHQERFTDSIARQCPFPPVGPVIRDRPEAIAVRPHQVQQLHPFHIL